MEEWRMAMKCNKGHDHNGQETQVLDDDGVDHQWDTCSPLNEKALDEALYALNRAIPYPADEFPVDEVQSLIKARDIVWSIIRTINPERRD
jgi:hypothetical protein